MIRHALITPEGVYHRQYYFPASFFLTCVITIVASLHIESHVMEQPPQLQQQQHLWVFELCALGGVPISIHYTMLLLVIIQVFAATLSYQDRTYNILMFLLYGPILLITAFIVSAPTPRLVADGHRLMLQHHNSAA